MIDCETEKPNAFPQVIHVRNHTFRADVSEADGSQDSAPGAHDYFDAALAACKTLTATWYAKKQGDRARARRGARRARRQGRAGRQVRPQSAARAARQHDRRGARQDLRRRRALSNPQADDDLGRLHRDRAARVSAGPWGGLKPRAAPSGKLYARALRGGDEREGLPECPAETLGRSDELPELPLKRDQLGAAGSARQSSSA